MAIIQGSSYGDPRKQASESPHGLTPNTIEALGDRMEKFLPGLSATAGKASHQFFDGILPDGAELSPTAGKMTRSAQFMPNSGGGSFSGEGGNFRGSNAFVTPQRPYQPEYESPDRQMYPVHRILANRYWRLFFKLDPVIGNCIDMYSTMPWSDFQLTGDGVQGEIKEAYETMCEETNILRTLEYMVKEYLVIGECVPHNFFDESRGIWTYTALHNPDQLEVIDAPFIKMEPVVEFIPDDRLRSVLTSSNQLLRKVREQMPPELLARLIARQNIPLSPVNMTFIPRRMHPYDTRGTSIISRMWRILMYEDAIYNASIATARRHAGPIKVAKLGNAATGWIPSQEHEQRLLQLLAQAELDSNAWLVYHYGINFELIGTTERVMNINQHHDVIERIKLIALGVSKSFLHGEVTYASSLTGLSVFLQRMKAMRNFLVHTWLIPKFFKPIAKINGWIKPTQQELNFRYRVKRSQRELDLDNRWIVPTPVWAKQLDHNVDGELVSAMSQLEGSLGIKFSKTTKFASVGKNYEEETKKRIEERKWEEQIAPQLPPEAAAGPGAPAGGGGLGGGGGGIPGMPTPSGGNGVEQGTEVGGPPAPGEGEMPSAGKHAEDTGPSSKKDPASIKMNSDLWDPQGHHGNWTASEVNDLSNLIREGVTDSPLWEQMKNDKFVKAVDSGDPWEVLEEVEEFLGTQGYPREDVKQLRRILDAEGVLRDIGTGDITPLKGMDRKMPDTGSLSDEDAESVLEAQIEGVRHDAVKLQPDDALLIGGGNWSGDVSSRVR